MFEALIKELEAETVAYMAMTGPYDQIPQGYGALYGWVAQHGLQPTGPPEAVYLTPPEGDDSGLAKWELWAPVAETGDIDANDAGIGVKHVPDRTVASTMYRGPYDGIEETYRSLGQWLSGQGYSLAGPVEEVYLSDPTDTPVEESLTEIRMPVMAAG